jgi:quercetin dioxygenase-like cupin family protein
MAITVTHIPDEHKDSRGAIAHVLDQNEIPLRSILRITSKKGSIRSNHYHKHDSHYIYIESGSCEYSEKPANEKSAKIETMTLGPGDVVLTKPMMIHAVKFLEDSVIYAFTTETRNQEKYEEDTERIVIVE